jgi:hypothetical protein
MSLNLTRILPQISHLGETIAERQRLQLETIPRAREGLTQAGHMGLEVLRERVAVAGNRWPGAAPSDEPVDQIYPAPPLPPRLSARMDRRYIPIATPRLSIT